MCTIKVEYEKLQTHACKKYEAGYTESLLLLLLLLFTQKAVCCRSYAITLEAQLRHRTATSFLVVRK
jgi:hypothetical protein